MQWMGLALEVPAGVYEPAEDSFMLAEGALSLRGRVLEIGCGSGIASLACARANPSGSVLGVDISPAAVECSRMNASLNRIRNAKFVRGDLFSAVQQKEVFDAMLFNPPYLPTAPDEKLSGPLNNAFDGGEGGREVLGRFLKDFDAHLRPGGTLLLIQSSLNGREETEGALRSMRYDVEAVAKESFFFERIFLLRAMKPQV